MGEETQDGRGARSGLRGGALLSALSRVSVAVTGAATTVVAAHVLKPAGFGAYSVALSLLIVMQVLITLGVEHGIVYYVSSGRWRPSRAFRVSQIISLVSGLGGICLCALVRAVAPSLFHGISFGAAVGVATALPFALSWFYGSYIALALGDFGGYALAPAVQSAAALCLVGGLGAWRGVSGAIAGLAASHAVTAAVRLVPMARRSRSAPTNAAPEMPNALRRAVSFGIKGNAANALQQINVRLDMFVLNAVTTSAAVGHYALAVSVTSLMTLLPRALSDVLFPRAAALSASGATTDAEALLSSERKALRHAVLLNIACGAGCVIGLLLLVVPVYGSGFRSSIGLGLVLLPGVALLGITSVLSAGVVGRGRPDASLRTMVLVTPATMIAYVVVIPPMHALGAAIVSTLSYAASFLVTCWWYRRIVGHGAIRAMTPGWADVTDYVGVIRDLARRAD